jgi:hypothetical protein
VVESGIVKKYLLLLVMALATAPALFAQKPVGELFSDDASVRGLVAFKRNGMHVLSGSQIAAGDGTALLKLERGGDLRICPKTSLSVSADAGGRSLVLGLNVGAMELDYTLPSAADSLITPDFRLQLISPGTFHFAISVAASGDTCVRTLRGNDAAVFIAEMMGGDSYQLSPGKSVMFKAGKISGATEAPAVCGCPETKPETRVPEVAAAVPAKKPTAELPPVADTPAADEKAEPHLKVESAFIYRGSEDYYTSVSRLSISLDNSKLALALLPQVSAPVAQIVPVERKRGFLSRFGSMLGRLFRN